MIKQASHKTYLYKRADMVGLKDQVTQFKDVYISGDHSHMYKLYQQKALPILCIYETVIHFCMCRK